MKAQVLIAFTLAFVCVAAFDADDYHYNAGAKFDQVQSDLSFGASVDGKKFKDSMDKAVEAHVKKSYAKGQLSGNAGLTYANDKYANAALTYADTVNNGQLGAQAEANYFNDEVKGNGVVGWQGVVSDVAVQAGAQASVDTNKNVDYKLGVKGTKNINHNVDVEGAAGLHNKDAALEAGVGYYLDQADARATGFANAEYNLDSKANNYGFGAKVNKKFVDNKLDATAGATFYPKSNSKVAFADASYADHIENGNVAANANVAYDLGAAVVTKKHLDASVDKNFGNGLSAGAKADFDGNQGYAHGKVNYAKNLDNSTQVKANANASYSLNAKAITNKEADASVEKDFNNGLTAGAGAQYVNDVTTANAHAKYTKVNNNILYKAGANVDYNVNSKDAKGVFGALANTQYNKDYNISAFAGLLTQFNNYYNGNFGALFNDVGFINSGGINVATNFRGAKPALGNVVATFKHVFDAETNMDVEVTRFPDNTFQLGGTLNKIIDGNKTFKAYFKMDKNGNFTFA